MRIEKKKRSYSAARFLHLRVHHKTHNAPSEQRRRCLDVADVEFNFWRRAVTHQHLHNVQSVFAIKCTAEDLDLVPGGRLHGNWLLLLRGGRGQVPRANLTVYTSPALQLPALRYSGPKSLFDFFLRLPSK